MERLWTKSFTFMTAGMLFVFTAFYMLYTALPLFIKELGGSEAQVGLVMGAFMLSAVIVRPAVGRLLDFFGSRPYVISGLLLFALAMYAYSWIGGIPGLILLRLVHGMTWAISTTALLTAITDLIPPSRRGEGMGWAGMAMTLAMAIGPMCGVWMIDHLSYESMFFVGFVLSLTSLLLTASVRLTRKPKEKVIKTSIVEKDLLAISIPVFFLFFAYGSITTFVPLFTAVFNVNSGFFFLVYAFTLILIRPVAGKLSDKNGEKTVIIPSLCLTVIALLILAFSTGTGGIFLSAVLCGIGFGSAQPALQAATIRLVKNGRTGAANASYSTATDLGIGLGAIILGWVSHYTSYRVLFLVSAGVVMLSLGTLFLFLKKKTSIHANIH